MIILLAIPGAYLVLSRLKTWPERISWIIINPALIFSLCFAFSENPLLSTVVIFLLSFISWQSAYDIGYLVNDFITVRYESKPNIRVKGELAQKIRKLLFPLIAIRIFVAAIFLLVCFLYWQETELRFRFGVFFIGMLLSQLLFFSHNFIRSRINILTYFFLCVTKYLTLPLSFYFGDNVVVVVFGIILVFPFLRTIEHSSKPKYKIKILSPVFSNLGFNRLIYYTLVFMLFSFLTLFFAYPEFKVFSCVSGFMLLYRAAIWFRYEYLR